MIRYALKCDRDHGFESWFGSADAFEALVARGAVTCPECGSAGVGKAPMAPRVGSGHSAGDMIARLRKVVEANSDYVGDRFATEARAIHEGAAPERSIWGEAAPHDARKLHEEGVSVVPLPFGPRRKMN